MAALNLNLMNQCRSWCTVKRKRKSIISGSDRERWPEIRVRVAQGQVRFVLAGHAHCVDRDVARQRPEEVRTSDERDDANAEDRHQQIEGCLRRGMILSKNGVVMLSGAEHLCLFMLRRSIRQ